MDSPTRLSMSDEQPTLADLQAVPWNAWRGLLLREEATLVEREIARARGLIEDYLKDNDVLVWVPTSKGSAYIDRLRELAAGLSNYDAVRIAGGAPASVDMSYVFEVAGLCTPKMLGGCRFCTPTPLGRAVLHVRHKFPEAEGEEKR